MPELDVIQGRLQWLLHQGRYLHTHISCNTAYLGALQQQQQEVKEEHEPTFKKPRTGCLSGTATVVSVMGFGAGTAGVGGGGRN
jgi:hypothetical protein